MAFYLRTAQKWDGRGNALAAGSNENSIRMGRGYFSASQYLCATQEQCHMEWQGHLGKIRKLASYRWLESRKYSKDNGCSPMQRGNTSTERIEVEWTLWHWIGSGAILTQGDMCVERVVCAALAAPTERAREQWHFNDHEHSLHPDPGFKISLSAKRNQDFLEKWLIPGVRR